MKLDAKGRCCGRKPIEYKLPYPGNGIWAPYKFCDRCDRAFTMDGQQMANWAWRQRSNDPDFVRTVR